MSFVCGFTALAYEVLWTRLLVFSTSSTVYSFSMMLGVFLIGIALGSFLVIAIFRSSLDLRTVLIFLQVSIGLYVIGSLYNMEQLLSAPWNGYNLQKPAFVFWRYFLDSSALMLFPTIALGMSFPYFNKNNIRWIRTHRERNRSNLWRKYLWRNFRFAFCGLPIFT